MLMINDYHPGKARADEIVPLSFRQPATEALNDNPQQRSNRRATRLLAGGFSQMRVIAAASQKGGSGKTTIAAHLAAPAAAAGHRPVVLIDADPQGSLGEWWQARNDDAPALTAVRPEDLAANLAALRNYRTSAATIDTPSSWREGQEHHF